MTACFILSHLIKQDGIVFYSPSGVTINKNSLTISSCIEICSTNENFCLRMFHQSFDENLIYTIDGRTGDKIHLLRSFGYDQ